MEKEVFKNYKNSQKYPRVSGVYMITNLINNKKYIGQALDIHHRWIQHTNRPFNSKENKCNSNLYTDIRKYGIENFSFQILEEADSKAKLKELEIKWIAKENTLAPNGYNETKGGDNVKGHIPEKDFWEIVKMLKNGSPAKPIMDRFGISIQTVTDINVGRYRKQPNIDYPIKKRTRTTYHCLKCGKKISKNKSFLCVSCYIDENREKTGRGKEFFGKVRKEVEESNISQVAKKYGASWHTVNKWLKK